MNKRIQELAKQAEDWADNQNFYESDYRDYLMEKFAKLLLEECLDIIKIGSAIDGSRDPDPYDEGYEYAVFQITERIEENFGVDS